MGGIMNLFKKIQLKGVMPIFLLSILFVCLSLILGCDIEVESEEGGTDDTVAYYRDSDGDGFGDSASFVKALTQPDGYINNSRDCDDTDASIYPEAPETPGDSIDSNCDGGDDT
jgi:hypothetical protein